MIKQYKILIISFLGVLHYNAQTSYSLEVNNIKARVNSSLHLFNKHDINSAGFTSVLNNNVGSIYNSSLWLAADQPNGDYSVSAEKFYQNGISDFQNGPVGTNYNPANNRIYTVTKNEINQHIDWSNCMQDQNCNLNSNFPNYTIPQSILDWPAHGDLSNNEAYNLAPFVDVNQDGIYSPIVGDYPKIRGDEAVFYMLNDSMIPNTSSGGIPIGVELHIMVYAFDSNIDAVNNTIFVNYKVYNRSSTNYTNLKIGSYTDFDIGCSSNDFVGCDTNRNMFYGYNKTSNDIANPGPNNCATGFNGAPAQGVKFLNKQLSSFIYYGTYGATQMSDPTSGTPAHFYNCLSSKWKDGSPLYYGGSGYYNYFGVSDTITNFLVPSFPSLNSGWSQLSFGGADSDVRALGVIKESNFNSGDLVCFDMAFTFNYDSSVNNIANVSQLFSATDQVQSFYDNNELGCDYLLTSIDDEEQIKQIKTIVFPNPFSESTKIDFNNTISKGKFSLYNSLGQNVGSYELLNQNVLRLERTNLQSGIYFFSVEENGIVLSNGKLIIE